MLKQSIYVPRHGTHNTPHCPLTTHLTGLAARLLLQTRPHLAIQGQRIPGAHPNAKQPDLARLLMQSLAFTQNRSQPWYQLQLMQL